MRELRIGTWVVAVMALAAFGCDDGNGTPDGGGGGEADGGDTLIDSGPGGGTDSGAGGEDSGTDPGGETCGPTDGACDISDPTSCGDGMACVLRVTDPETSEATTTCVPAGTGTDGTTCSTDSTTPQCAEGFDCSQFESVCRRNCCSNADCNPPGMPTGQVCLTFSNGGPPGQMAGICVQSDSCSLVEQTGCPEGEACTLFDLGLTLCRTPGTGAPGDECAETGCAAGGICISGEPARCREYCDMAAETPCGTGFACAGLTDAPEGVGVCVPME